MARLASSLPANPLESTARALAIQVPGLSVVPQHPVPVPGTGVVLHPDIADPVRRLAIETEGFEWHGEVAALTRDCRRYNTLTLLGWTVVRFSWVLVMTEPAYVQETLVRAVGLEQGLLSDRPDLTTHRCQSIQLPRDALRMLLVGSAARAGTGLVATFASMPVGNVWREALAAPRGSPEQHLQPPAREKAGGAPGGQGRRRTPLSTR